MRPEPEITVRRLTPETLDAFLEVMAERAFGDSPEWAGCYCWFPYWDPERGDFDARAPQDNREAMAQAVREGRASGYLAFAHDSVVGWVNAAPRVRFPQLAKLPGDGARTGATPCFTIDPAWRRRGIARRLLAAAIDGLREDGMARMEAGPYSQPKDDAHRYRGTVELYESAGYEKVAELSGGTTLMEKRLD
jgi:ribosomal protein S18 acetylase RimI-like enzyme